MLDVSPPPLADGPQGLSPPLSDRQADRLLNLVHWSSAASRHLRRRLAEIAATFDLSDTDLLLVWLCCGGGRVQVDLAGAIGISPAQMSGTVERLRSRGLVAMHRLAQDRRRQVWRATTAGQDLLVNAAIKLDELAVAIGCGFGEGETQQALELFQRLAEAAAAIGQEQPASREAA